MTFEEIDSLPQHLVIELSARTLAPYALALRGKYRNALNDLKRKQEQLQRAEEDLQKARGACRRMSSNVKVRGDGPASPARRPSGEAAPRPQG